jgi:hypothetical protein
MTTDPHKDAARYLRDLVKDGWYERNRQFDLPISDLDRLAEIAELLDPTPKPTLRDEFAAALRGTSSGSRWNMTDDLLAIVDRHVQTLDGDEFAWHAAITAVRNLLNPKDTK